MKVFLSTVLPFILSILFLIQRQGVLVIISICEEKALLIFFCVFQTLSPPLLARITSQIQSRNLNVQRQRLLSCKVLGTKLSEKDARGWVLGDSEQYTGVKMTVIHLEIKMCISACSSGARVNWMDVDWHTQVFLEEPLGLIVPLSQLIQ